MKDICIAAVEKAIGRSVNAKEAQGIEDRIRYQMRALASKDPQTWAGLSTASKLQQAAQQAAKQLVSEAQLKKRRLKLTIDAHDRIEAFSAAHAGGRLDAIDRVLAFKADAKSNTQSVESRRNSIRTNAARQLIAAFEASGAKVMGLFENMEGVTNLVREVFGENTGSAEARKGAQAWADVTEQMKTHFNDAGGHIGDLEDWAMPQHHAQSRVWKAGQAQWVADILPKLDRKKYFNEDGSQMTDAQITALLKSSFESISTNGLNKIEPGLQRGTGMRANAMSEHRVLHFKDADSYIEYQKLYGEKDLYQVMMSHIDSLARNIAMTEVLGPNPDLTFKYFVDKGMKEDALAGGKNPKKIEEQGAKLMRFYGFVSGKGQIVADERIAKGFDSLRSWLVSSRLGSAFLSSFSDEATIHLTAKLNNLSSMKVMRNQFAALNPADKNELRLAQRAGLALDSMIGELNRWGTEELGSNYASKMATTVMRASFLPAITDARKRAFGVTMMSGIGHLTRTVDLLAKLDKQDNRILLSKGFTEENWQVLRKAAVEDWGNGNDSVLHPDSIMRISDPAITDAMKRDALHKFLGAVLEETNMAVIEPGLRDRFLTSGQFTRGTWTGELARSFFLFKSFPIAMISRHWMRGASFDTKAGRAAYIASLIATTTLLGAASMTINDLISGKNPANFNPFEGDKAGRNWMKATLKGGSLGIYGDYLFADGGMGDQGILAALEGPVFGLLDQADTLLRKDPLKAAAGEDVHWGADTVKFFKGLIPGANLWYAKAALDHMIFNQMQEYFSPGYLARMESRARNTFGQTFWWRPGGGLEDMHPPDLTKAVGG